MNQLNVDSNNLTPQQVQHLKPRRSIIGKLERSSFQAQRLSDVGVAFSQQITAKVGLKLPASQERIVEQTRWLYLRYVFVKLRENKLPLRDLNLTKSSRARRAAALGASNEAQIIVSISEPATADPLALDDRKPLFDRINHEAPPAIGMSRRKRSSLLPARIDHQHFSLLAARVDQKRQILRHQRECIDRDERNNIDQRLNEDALDRNLKRTTNNSNFRAKLASVAANLSTTNLGSRISNIRQREISNGNKMDHLSTDISKFALYSNQATNNRKYLMDPTINNQIFTVITNMIKELRESRPEFYGDTIYEVIGLDKFSLLDSLLEVQKTLCQEMTRTEISWDRIVALFSLFGAMSLDCVRLGAPEHVGPILDGFIGFVERDLALWISQQGGWESFLYKFRTGYQYGYLYKLAAFSIPILILWALLIAYGGSLG